MILYLVGSFESQPCCYTYTAIYVLRDDELALAELQKDLIFDHFSKSKTQRKTLGAGKGLELSEC